MGIVALAKTIKQKMGPLWWYTVILFFALRFCDVVNAFIGVWLVPKYVPQEELGAVLPLAQVGGVLGLPLAIVLVPFTKFLNTYATREEYGKVKRLLSDVFALSLVLFFGTLFYARFFMPLVFERMRVGKGSLGLLIIASGVISTVSPVFMNALQALKKFRMITVANLLAAPVRLVAMLVFMPIRAISGYFVGQSAPSIFLIAAALFGLRGQLGRAVRAEPYWKTDWHPIIRYTIPVALLTASGVVQTMVESFLIRHRLPALDSAGYYVISRFAEIGAYVGLTFIFVLFPLAAERHEKGVNSDRLLWQSMGGTLTAGIGVALFFYFFGKGVLGLLPIWNEYLSYWSSLVILTLVYALRTAASCFASHEMAYGRFGFVWYFMLIAGVECALLYSLTGYSFFEGMLPENWIAWMASVNASRLDFILQVMAWSAGIPFLCMGLQLAFRHLVRRGKLRI